MSRKVTGLTLASGLVKELDRERKAQGDRFRSRSDYVEHLLRTHPDRNPLFHEDGTAKAPNEVLDDG